jgi:hypothetical protein
MGGPARGQAAFDRCRTRSVIRPVEPVVLASWAGHHPAREHSVDAVGRLTIAKQDVSSVRGKAIAEKVEGFAFDPWHALVAHKPLGSMMRARNFAYRESTDERKASKEPEAGEARA